MAACLIASNFSASIGHEEILRQEYRSFANVVKFMNPPYPEFLNPVAIPLMVTWIVFSSSSVYCPWRIRLISSI